MRHPKDRTTSDQSSHLVASVQMNVTIELPQSTAKIGPCLSANIVDPRRSPTWSSLS